MEEDQEDLESGLSVEQLSSTSETEDSSWEHIWFCDDPKPRKIESHESDTKAP